jgi:hypothetical protein
VLIWDPTNPSVEPRHLGTYNSTAWAVAALPDGRIVSADNDERVLVWDPTNPTTEPHHLGTHYGVTAVAVLPDGRIVTAGGRKGRVLIWNPTNPTAEPRLLTTYNGPVWAVAVLPDGRVVTVGHGDGRVLVWDPTNPTTEPHHVGTHFGGVAALPDGRIVTIGRHDGRVLIWDPTNPTTEPHHLGTYHDNATAVAVLPDGRIVTANDFGLGPSDPDNGWVLIWDPTNPTAEPHHLTTHNSPVKAVGVLPDGQVVTAGSDRRVLIWDDRTGRSLGRLPCSAVVLATSIDPSGAGVLVVAHAAGGLSSWTLPQRNSDHALPKLPNGNPLKP